MERCKELYEELSRGEFLRPRSPKTGMKDPQRDPKRSPTILEGPAQRANNPLKAHWEAVSFLANRKQLPQSLRQSGCPSLPQNSHSWAGRLLVDTVLVPKDSNRVATSS